MRVCVRVCVLPMCIVLMLTSFFATTTNRILTPIMVMNDDDDIRLARAIFQITVTFELLCWAICCAAVLHYDNEWWLGALSIGPSI